VQSGSNIEGCDIEGCNIEGGATLRGVT
jgi:hypothetical protein